MTSERLYNDIITIFHAKMASDECDCTKLLNNNSPPCYIRARPLVNILEQGVSFTTILKQAMQHCSLLQLNVIRPTYSVHKERHTHDVPLLPIVVK